MKARMDSAKERMRFNRVNFSLLVEVWLNTTAMRPVDRESFGGGQRMHDGHWEKNRWSSKQMQPPDWATGGLFGQSIGWSLAGLQIKVKSI